jgi:hypothetical protein
MRWASLSGSAADALTGGAFASGRKPPVRARQGTSGKYRKFLSVQ